MSDIIAKAGGIFAYLTFCHFVADWIFQTHNEAMTKHKNWKTRAIHCYVYTFLMTLAIVPLHLSFAGGVISSSVFFFSHFIEDTYIPVAMWAKYIRRVDVNFETFVETPLGKILMIAVDQIIHLTFLWVPVWLSLR